MERTPVRGAPDPTPSVRSNDYRSKVACLLLQYLQHLPSPLQRLRSPNTLQQAIQATTIILRSKSSSMTVGSVLAPHTIQHPVLSSISPINGAVSKRRSRLPRHHTPDPLDNHHMLLSLNSLSLPPASCILQQLPPTLTIILDTRKHSSIIASLPIKLLRMHLFKILSSTFLLFLNLLPPFPSRLKQYWLQQIFRPGIRCHLEDLPLEIQLSGIRNS